MSINRVSRPWRTGMDSTDVTLVRHKSVGNSLESDLHITPSLQPQDVKQHYEHHIFIAERRGYDVEVPKRSKLCYNAAQ